MFVSPCLFVTQRFSPASSSSNAGNRSKLHRKQQDRRHFVGLHLSPISPTNGYTKGGGICHTLLYLHAYGIIGSPGMRADMRTDMRTDMRHIIGRERRDGLSLFVLLVVAGPCPTRPGAAFPCAVSPRSKKSMQALSSSSVSTRGNQSINQSIEPCASKGHLASTLWCEN